MSGFRERVIKHQADYKRNKLGIEANGLYKKVPRSHILPIDCAHLNILEPFREEFWIDFQSWGISKHLYFAHLNSSQAMCFNLFYPCMPIKAGEGIRGTEREDAPAHRRELMGSMGLDKYGHSEKEISCWRFEYILNGKEGTNFDLLFDTDLGNTVLVEVKYTEREFGTASVTKSQCQRLETIYKPVLEPHVCATGLSPEFFFKHYQLFRHAFYAAQQDEALVILIFPKKNKALYQPLKEFREKVSERLNARIRVCHLEQIVNDLRKVGSSTEAMAAAHYRLFEEKYIRLS